MGADDEKKEQRIRLLTDEELHSAAKQIAYDLGVTPERALDFAKEAQEELYYDRKDLVTRETVVTVADNKHLPDDDVPAELVPINQGTKAFPGENLVKGVVDFAKSKYDKVKN